VDFDYLQKVFSIIVIDLVLSGDNAVVIGMAARRLDPVNRKRAIVWGGVGAVVLRITFTAMAAILLDVPYLAAAGGVLLLWIALRLIKPHHVGEGEAHIQAAGSLGEAIRTIVLADVVMSLDNILAVGGAAAGHLELLLFGLALSIPILLLGSNLVARVLQRLPILLYVGVLVLVHAAIGMIMHDKLVEEVYKASELTILIITLVVSAAIVALARVLYGAVAGIGEEGGVPETSPGPELVEEVEATDPSLPRRPRDRSTSPSV
jgi:YjbE family integral membrane protein